MKRTTSTLCSLIAVTQAAVAADTSAVSSQTPDLLTKPTWLTEASVTLKEGYDNNVFMSGVGQPYLPAGLETLKDRGSFLTTVSPKVGVNFASMLGSNSLAQVLSLTYAPDFVRYAALPTENYDAHRAIVAAKGSEGDFSYVFDDTLTFNDASRVAPSYPGDLLNAWGTIYAYQRREALLDRAKTSFRYDLDHWFIRPNAYLAYYGMMTELMNPDAPGTPSGYQNYAPRYDVNGGLDVGYKLTPDLALLVGYRFGHCEQEQFSFLPYSSSSDYQRALLGLEGKPVKWLDLQLLGGPDFRDYQADSATHITPLNDLHPVTYYGDANITATLSSSDSLLVKYKGYEFVSCLGKVPYFDSSYCLAYRRKLMERLSLETGAKLLEADYSEGNLAACRRRDLDYVFTAGLHYDFSKHVAVDLSYQADLGRNDENDIVNSSTRQFDRDLVSLAIQIGL